MKKTIVRLTEQDLHQLISESVKQIIREWDDIDDDRYDRDYDDYSPSFNNPTVYFNPETKECVENEASMESGIWYECECEVTDYHVENDGIGSYEYWGEQCYDEGHDSIVADEADAYLVGVYQVDENGDTEELDVHQYSLGDEESSLIGEYAIDNDLFEQID